MIRGVNADGEDMDVPFEDILKLHFETTKVLYFEYMTSKRGSTVDSFKDEHLEYCDRIITLMDGIYADHLEGLNRELDEGHDG